LAFFLYVGKRLHTFCTPFAHLPESGAFLRMACTACFPLHNWMNLLLLLVCGWRYPLLIIAKGGSFLSYQCYGSILPQA
jgi:hypothetical protein